MFFRFYLQQSKRFIQQRAIRSSKKELSETLWQIIEKNKIKSPKEWKNLRQEILETDNSITKENIDAMTVGVCTAKKDYKLALSYINFLNQENIEINLATLGKCFIVFYLRGIEEELSAESENQILTMYNNVRKLYPVLDSITLERMIQALSLTKQWQIGVSLLDEIKVASTPSANAYSAIASAAFLNNSEELAWKVLDEMIEKNRIIQNVVYSSYLKNVAKSSTKLSVLEKLFNFFHKKSIKLETTAAVVIMEALKNMEVDVNFSTVHKKGICQLCDKKLQVYDLLEEEFVNLKNKVLQSVIVGKDVFNKTTFDELNRFKSFVENIDKFDVIIDGLNVAYSTGVQHSPVVTSGLVASVVSHFVNNRKKVLVLGRKHMNKWPKKNWNYVLQNSSTFLTENLSQDDPYLLYCALHSGKDTIIVTRDLMRGHKFLLREVHLKTLFERWLAQRQHFLLYVKNDGTPVFKKPLPFSQIAQKIEDFWHLPVIDTSLEIATSSKWLCINCNKLT